MVKKIQKIMTLLAMIAGSFFMILALSACKPDSQTETLDGEIVASDNHWYLPKGAIILEEYRNNDWFCIEMDGILFLSRQAGRESVLAKVDRCPWMNDD